MRHASVGEAKVEAVLPVRLLMDTQIFFRMFRHPKKIGQKLWKSLRDSENGLYFSAASALRAQAQLESLTLITSDRVFTQYDVKCIIV
jgi:PIN domain nuclease of toxin-antitoxin system